MCFSLSKVNPSVSSGGRLIIVSVANKGKPDVTAFVVSLQPVPELFDIVLYCFNPHSHRPSAVHHETEVHLCDHRQMQEWYHTLYPGSFSHVHVPRVICLGLFIETVAERTGTIQFQLVLSVSMPVNVTYTVLTHNK